MIDNYIQNARKDKSLIHKYFLFIPIFSDIIPIVLILLNRVFNFDVHIKLIFICCLLLPAADGIIMVVIIIWYFIIWKVKSFSNYAFYGIAFSIFGCIESYLLLYLLYLALRCY